MKKNIIAACAVSAMLIASPALALDSKENCMRGDAKTVDAAFTLGVKLAKDAGLELGAGENKAQIRILPKNDHDLYVVEVCHAPCEDDNPNS